MTPEPLYLHSPLSHFDIDNKNKIFVTIIIIFWKKLKENDIEASRKYILILK